MGIPSSGCWKKPRIRLAENVRRRPGRIDLLVVSAIIAPVDPQGDSVADVAKILKERTYCVRSGFLHGTHDAPGLLLQISSKVGIDEILANQSRLKRFRIQNIAFHHAHAVGMAG